MSTDGPGLRNVADPDTATAGSTGEEDLPRWLARYATLAPTALAVGVALCLLSLFTNAVPDPSFPWFSLPAGWRLPITQPRIEHWPVTYSVGIWLWILFLPGLFLLAYRRFGDRLLGNRLDVRPATWLVGLPTLAMLGLTTYCRFFWPKPTPATWNAPSYTFVCWLYCSTYDAVWSNAAYTVALVGVVAFGLAWRRSSATVAVEGLFGLLALPLGLPALYDAYRRHE